MSLDDDAEPRRLELPDPYRLQNRLLWACAALLLAAGATSLGWAREAMQAEALRLAAAALATGLALLAGGLACGAGAARRRHVFVGRGRPASLAPEIPPGANGGSPLADALKERLRQGELGDPAPGGAADGWLDHAMPALAAAPRTVQELARRSAFDFAAIAASLACFVFAWAVLGTEATRPWIGVLYLAFGALFVLRPLLPKDRAPPLTRAALVGLLAAAILGPMALGALAPHLPAPGGFAPDAAAFTLLATALVAGAFAMAAVLAQVDRQPPARTSLQQGRLSMNAPPSALMAELDRTLQSRRTERMPNRRYARIDPATPAGTPSGSFASELLEETQPLPVAGARAPTFVTALRDRRHRRLLLLDLYAAALVAVAIGLSLAFVRSVDAAARLPLLAHAALLGVVAAFCLRCSARLWGRFDFESVLVWVEMIGTWQRESDVARTDALTLRVWRARVESVAFGKDGARQLTAMFSTDSEARALASHLMQFARSHGAFEDPSLPPDGLPAAEVHRQLRAAAAMGTVEPPSILDLEPDNDTPPVRCATCGTAAQRHARFCSHCGTALPA